MISNTASKSVVSGISSLPLLCISLFFSLLASPDAYAQTGARKAYQVSPTRAAATSASGRVNPQLTPYLTRLQSKVSRNWYLADGHNHVEVSVNVAPDGTSSDVTVTSNPKSEPAQNAAMDAFNKCLPLEPLPSGLSGGKLVLKFDSSADPHGDSNSHVIARFDPASPAKASGAPGTPNNNQAAPQAAEPSNAQTVPQTAAPNNNNSQAPNAENAQGGQTQESQNPQGKPGNP